MIVRRNKKFSNTSSPETSNNIQQQISSRDLQLEGMRIQRQLMKNSQTRERIQSEENLSEMKNLQHIQKIEARKDEVDKKNQVKLQQYENQRNLVTKSMNQGRINKSKITPPVSMKH